MKKAPGLTLTACCAALATSSALAGTEVGSWYVAPQAQGLWIDDTRNADDDPGFGLALGRTLSDKWNFEFGLFTSNHDRTAGQKLKLEGFQAGVQRLFYRESRVNPFIAVGLGRIENKTTVSSDSDFFGTYGVGFVADLAKRLERGTNLQLRGDIMGRRVFSSGSGVGDPVDYVAGLGLQYSWGATPPPPPPPPDSDGDGVTDDLDKCPGTPAGTAVDASGCPLDSDGDGVLDANDKCPNTPAGTLVDSSGCELDSDGDGVVDSKDKCPNTPAGAKVDADGCELDTDGDGVLDGKDQCPDTPKGDRVDMFGCSFQKEIRLPGVVFDTNKADLRAESYPILDGAAEVLKRYAELRIEVAGHTDSSGSDAYNLDLSNRRAASVMAYLKDKGVANTLRSRGYGERQPIASNSNDEGRQQNRRVVLRILN